MASPQKENGYTSIAHEIIEALAKIKIPGQARQVLDVIFRKTYGWNKSIDEISLKQFVECTGLSKVRVCRGIQNLLSMNIITKNGNAISHFTKNGNDYSVTYGIQKDYDKWRTLPKMVTLPKKITYVTKKDNVTLPKSVMLPIKTNNKLSNTKLTNVHFDQFWEAYPKKKNKGQARKTWEGLIKKKALPEISILLNAITAQKAGQDWQKDGGKWIPHPSTWLNAEGWEDEIINRESTSNLRPQTYAQAQDAERRQRNKWLLKEIQNEKSNSQNHSSGAFKTIGELPES